MLATVHYGRQLPLSFSVQLLTGLCRVVVVIMALSSLAFYAMAFRVPVVRSPRVFLPGVPKLTLDAAKTPVPRPDRLHHDFCFPLVLRHGYW